LLQSLSAQSVAESPSLLTASPQLVSRGDPLLHEQPEFPLPQLERLLQLVVLDEGMQPWHVLSGLTVPEPTALPPMQHPPAEGSEHETEFLSLEHTYRPHPPAPQVAPGLALSEEQPPHAFTPGSLHVTEVLFALHTYLPHEPHDPFGVPFSAPHPPQALRPGSEQDTEFLSALHT
jgi:hypothetical protein